MKKFFALLLSGMIMFGTFDITYAAEIGSSEVSLTDFLLGTGMTQEEVDQIDADFRGYIVENLRENAGNQELEFVETEAVSVIEPRVNQSLSGIKFTVSSWKSGNTIYIYPTYEFTTAKRPRGQDSFSFQLGDAMRPHTYGGKIWYKMDAEDEWQSDSSDTMIANNQMMNGAEYSGTQLGTPDFNIYLKGCAYAYADVGSGTDQRILMSYMHNPNNRSYSISFSAKGVGISYSSPSTVYTAAKTFTLSY